MNKFKELFALALVLAASLDEASCWLWGPKRTEFRCGEHEEYKKKPNMEVSSPSQFPFLVQVQSQNATKRRECAGALIKANLVLTSHECFESSQSTYQVALGSEMWTSSEAMVLKGKEEVYHKFNSSNNNYRCEAGDGLQVLYLGSRLPYSVPDERKQGSKPINRVCSDTDDTGANNNLIGKRVIAVGWRKRQSKNKKAIAMELVIRECDGDEAKDGAICFEPDTNYDKLVDLMDGSVLVRGNFFGEWDLLGIYTKLVDERKFIDVRKKLYCQPSFKLVA